LIRVFAGELDGLRGICVADNGAGFDMAHASQLFQPFRRLHRQDEFPGLGIGLATVQRIVQRHGGEVRARAAPGEGAMFCFTLGSEPQAA
jgi:light-regulated signal transduction histidine kinase (bacteriophytochrome)